MKPIDDCIDYIPVAPEAERALLAVAMQDHTVIETIDLKPSAFHDHRAIAVWAAMKAGARSIPLLRERLGEDWEPGYIGEIHSIGAKVADAPGYAAAIRDAAGKRQIREACLQTLQSCANGHSAAGIADWLKTEIERHEEGTARFDFAPMTCQQLMRADVSLDYLIEGLLVDRQNMLVCGPFKSLKTSFLLDLALALVTAGCFLGYFHVLRAVTVAIVTGESGLATIKDTLQRIARAAGIDPESLTNLIISDRIPQLSNPAHLSALRKFITDYAIEVLMIDPAYLAMAEAGADAGNLFLFGEQLRRISALCQELGVTLILCHHSKKAAGADYEPLELSSVAWAGFAEHCRQWLLLNHREKYADDGSHRMHLRAGGSAGHGGLWAVDVHQGKQTDQGGRVWKVEVMQADEARHDVQERQREAHQKQRQENLDADRTEIARVAAKGPDSKSGLRDGVSFGHKRFDAAFASLVQDGTLRKSTVTKTNGQTYPGWELSNEQE
jgi:hypothetical protein